MASLFSATDLGRLIDIKSNFVLAVTNNSNESATMVDGILAFIEDTDAVIYGISLASYTGLDTSYRFPKLSETTAPAIITVKDRKVQTTTTLKSDKSVFSKKSKVVSYLESKVNLGSLYDYTPVNSVVNDSNRYYFYTNTDGELAKYIFSDSTGTTKENIVAVFYDSTSDRDNKFVYDFLLKQNKIVNNIKYLLIDVTLEKYTYDSGGHTFTPNYSSFRTYAQRYTFGFYTPASETQAAVTPAINYYEAGNLKHSIIYGNENFEDPQSTYTVFKSTKAIANWIKGNVKY